MYLTNNTSKRRRESETREMKSSNSKKSKRQEERERQEEIKRVLAAANGVSNYLQPPFFHAFSAYSRNGFLALLALFLILSTNYKPFSLFSFTDWR